MALLFIFHLKKIIPVFVPQVQFSLCKVLLYTLIETVYFCMASDFLLTVYQYINKGCSLFYLWIRFSLWHILYMKVIECLPFSPRVMYWFNHVDHACLSNLGVNWCDCILEFVSASRLPVNERESWCFKEIVVL